MIFQLYRDNPYAVLNRGLAYYKLGKYQPAKADLSKAVRMNPNFDMAIYHLALIARKEGDMNAAIENFSKVIEINPNAAPAWNERGKIRYSQKDYEAAAQDFKYADDVASKDMRADTSFWLALSSYQIGYYEQALESALISDDLRPDYYQTLGLLGDIYAQNGDVNNAEDYYRKAEGLAGKRAPFYRARIAALRR